MVIRIEEGVISPRNWRSRGCVLHMSDGQKWFHPYSGGLPCRI